MYKKFRPLLTMLNIYNELEMFEFDFKASLVTKYSIGKNMEWRSVHS